MQGIEIGVNRIGARGDIALVKIKGYVDTNTSSELNGVLSKLLRQDLCQFIIDMGRVNYVSSAGWGVFVGEIRGIRESGGDLKIVQMTPDVYEVFSMLEFNKILDVYETIEEAINDFDIMMGLDITRSLERKPIQIKKNELTIAPPASKSSSGETEKKVKKWSFTSRPKANEATMPLIEKIKIIIIENPTKGIGLIRKELNSQRFGFEKIGFFKLKSLLKRYNLETQEKRYRFYRSR